MMKISLTITLFLFFYASFSQVEIKAIPIGGVMLNEGWKLNSGDNAIYSTPNFDDSKWQAVNPASDVHSVPELWKNNIVWFRLHLIIDSNIGNNVALML